MKNTKGFTLIELLIVIGIIAILASGVIVAINPGRQFQQARNATRSTHMATIRSAVMSFAAENNGNFPAEIPDDCEGTSASYCTSIGDPITSTDPWHTDTSETITAVYNATGEELDVYLNQIPEDPQDDGGTPTYWLRIADGNNLQVISTATEWLDESDHTREE
jgi:prepilin-type N-terminal cleavage/methylation domain-containing protein